MIIALNQYWYLDLELDLPSTDNDLALSKGQLNGSNGLDASSFQKIFVIFSFRYFYISILCAINE